MHHTKILLLLFFIFGSGSLWSDKIITIKKEELTCSQVRILDDSIEYYVLKEKRNIKKSDVSQIVYADGQAVQISKKPPEDPEFHRHIGYLFRIIGGYGYLGHSIQNNQELKNYDLNDLGIVARYELGFAPKENLIYTVSLGMAGFQLLKMRYNNSDVKITPAIIHIGGGFNYYFMPNNYYLSISLNYTQALYSVEEIIGNGAAVKTSYHSGPGFGIYLSVGKEWWVSDNWGIGVAPYIYYGQVFDGKSYSDVKNSGPVANFMIGAAFTATYN